MCVGERDHPQTNRKGIIFIRYVPHIRCSDHLDISFTQLMVPFCARGNSFSLPTISKLKKKRKFFSSSMKVSVLSVKKKIVFLSRCRPTREGDRHGKF